MSDFSNFLKAAAIQIGAGGSAGFVEVCIMHPLDVVKTRLQLQSRVLPNSPHHYHGILDCLVKMRQSEGVFAFWKGILPPILAETPKRAVKFVCFEQYKRFFLFGSPTPTPLVRAYACQSTSLFPLPKPVVFTLSVVTLQTFSLAGMFAGVTEAFFVNPFEVVKVSMQSDKTHMSQLPSTWVTTRRIIASEGLGAQGLYRGVTATVARNAVFNSIYFGFYHTAKSKIPPNTDHTTELLYRLLIGFASGVMGSCCNIPFDVAKSRMQAPNGLIKYKSTTSTLAIVVREEGWRALFKGLVPKVMRLGPGGAIMMVVFEYSHAYLTALFIS